jgi:ABC-type sugar transport system ATPase subunit
MLSDWIAVMSDGEIEQYGTPNEVYREPNNRFVASFVGMPEMNMWRGETDGSTVTVDLGDQTVDLAVRDAATDAERKARSGIDERSSDEVEIGFRPQALSVVAAGAGDFDADLDLVEPMGENSLCYIDSPIGEIRVVEESTEGLSEGTRVGIELDRHRGYIFDGESGSTIARTGETSPESDGVSGRAATDD